MIILGRPRHVCVAIFSLAFFISFLHGPAEASTQPTTRFSNWSNADTADQDEAPTSEPVGINASELFQLEVLNDAEDGDQWLVLRGKERGIAISGDGTIASLYIDKWGGVYLEGDLRIFGSLKADDVQLSNGERLTDIAAVLESANKAWWKIRAEDVRALAIAVFVVFLYRLGRRTAEPKLP